MKDIIGIIFAGIGLISLIRALIIEDDRWFRLMVIIMLFYLIVKLIK